MQLEEYKVLAPYTTIGLGGPARWFTSCSTPEELTEALKWASSRDQKVLVLAGGSNSLIADEGFSGLVIHLKLTGIRWQESGAVTIAAGENWDEFVSAAVQRGFAGIECLSGIPGSVGSTPIQNVGAYGQEVKDTIVSVDVLNRSTLEKSTFTNSDCIFSYRMSRFKRQDRDKFVVLAVTFQLRPNDVTAIKYAELGRALTNLPEWQNSSTTSQRKLQLIRDTVIDIRARKGMVISAGDPDSKSLGSFFMNPIVTAEKKAQVLAIAEQLKLTTPPAYPETNDQWKLSAAWLIENSGTTKGERYRGAGVSSKHCLALINADQATTKDILYLADTIRERVRLKFAVGLQQEPEFIS